MSFFAEPNHIEYDAWFDENIDPVDLVNYSEIQIILLDWIKQLMILFETFFCLYFWNYALD